MEIKTSLEIQTSSSGVTNDCRSCTCPFCQLEYKSRMAGTPWDQAGDASKQIKRNRHGQEIRPASICYNQTDAARRQITWKGNASAKVPMEGIQQPLQITFVEKPLALCVLNFSAIFLSEFFLSLFSRHRILLSNSHPQSKSRKVIGSDCFPPYLFYESLLDVLFTLLHCNTTISHCLQIVQHNTRLYIYVFCHVFYSLHGGIVPLFDCRTVDRVFKRPGLFHRVYILMVYLLYFALNFGQ